MRILVIDDDNDLRELLKKSLSEQSFVVDTASDGASGSYVARTNHYNVIVMDYMMPRKDGLTVCKELRKANINTPIIIMSVKSEVPDKVALLEAGADDYICKPFSFAELSARIRSLTRRPYQLQESIMTLDDVTINTNSQQVEVSGQRIYLTRKEYMLLDCMAKKCGQVISRSEIMEEVWNNDSDPFSNTVEAHIRNLRKKIESRSSKRIIHTMPGRGYKLDRNK